MQMQITLTVLKWHRSQDLWHSNILRYKFNAKHKLYRSLSYGRSCFCIAMLSATGHTQCIFLNSLKCNTDKILKTSFQRFWAGSVKHFWLSIWRWNSGRQRPRSTRLMFWNTVTGRQFWQCNQCIRKTGRCHRSIGWRCTCLNIKHQCSQRLLTT